MFDGVPNTPVIVLLKLVWLKILTNCKYFRLKCYKITKNSARGKYEYKYSKNGGIYLKNGDLGLHYFYKNR